MSFDERKERQGKWCDVNSLPRPCGAAASTSVTSLRPGTTLRYSRDVDGKVTRRVVRERTEPTFFVEKFGTEVISTRFSTTARDGSALKKNGIKEINHMDRPLPWVNDLYWKKRCEDERDLIKRQREGEAARATARPGTANGSAFGGESTRAPGSARRRPSSSRGAASSRAASSARGADLIMSLEDRIELERTMRLRAEEELLMLKKQLRTARLGDIEEEIRLLRAQRERTRDAAAAASEQ